MRFIKNIKTKLSKREEAKLKNIEAKTKRLKNKNKILAAYNKQKSTQSKIKKAKIKRIKDAIGLNKQKRISSSPFALEKWK